MQSTDLVILTEILNVILLKEKFTGQLILKIGRQLAKQATCQTGFFIILLFLTIKFGSLVVRIKIHSTQTFGIRKME
jgi:hypothetical protein